MTVLYKPVLIESVEQAEQLPVGTIANRVLKFESIWETLEQPEVAVKIGRNAWHSTAVDDDAWDWLDRHLVGWTALVPVEAEEEWTPMVDGHAYVNGKKSEAHVRATVAEWPGAATGHRLVTPWEPVSGLSLDRRGDCA